MDRLAMGDNNINGTTGHRHDEFSKFVSSYPKKLSWKNTDRSDDHRRVFWTRNDSESNSSSYTYLNSQQWSAHEKIKSVFSNVYGSPVKSFLLQFWAPVRMNDGKRLLSMSEEPFALDHFDPRHQRYRLWCMNQVAQLKLPLPTYVLVQMLPNVFHDLRWYKGIPFVDEAIDCGFTTAILLPVFATTPTQTTPLWVGVVECCLKVDDVYLLFVHLKTALQEVGLSLYHVHHLYKTSPVFKPTIDEFSNALRFVCESHSLDASQVWIDNKFESHFSSNPLVKNQKIPAQTTPGMYVVKLCGYCSSDVSNPFIYDYYASCDVLPYKFGYGFVGKTLQTHQPHFCKYLPEMSDEWLEGLSGLLSISSQCASFTLCLRRTTSTIPFIVDYAFEFLWDNNRDHVIVMESLLSTLKMCLPCLILASGSQIGDELRVIDVHEENPQGTIIDLFKLPEDDVSSQPPVKQVLDGIPVGKAINVVKRKFSELSMGDGEDQTEPNAESGGFFEYDYDVAVFTTIRKGKERVEKREFFTRTSYKLAHVKENIENKYNLDAGTYTMEYEVYPNYKGMLDTDENLATCMKLWKIVTKKSGIDTGICVVVEKKDDHRMAET